MSRKKIIVDTETSGLNPHTDQLLELALVDVNDPNADIMTLILPHDPRDITPEAAAVNGYYRRNLGDPSCWASRAKQELAFRSLAGATLVGANPAFDAGFLAAYAGRNELPALWHYRMLDVESVGFAQGVFDDVPSLVTLTEYCRAQGGVIPEPDHTAAGDVATTLAVYRFLDAGRCRTDAVA